MQYINATRCSNRGRTISATTIQHIRTADNTVINCITHYATRALQCGFFIQRRNEESNVCHEMLM
jgi:hypothetical protein